MRAYLNVVTQKNTGLNAEKELNILMYGTPLLKIIESFGVYCASNSLQRTLAVDFCLSVLRLSLKCMDCDKTE